LSILAGLLVLAGCSTQQALNYATPDSGYRLATNIVYDGANRLALDVYSPEHPHNAPLVVFFYGGRWEQESTKPKEDYKFVGEALAERGFVAVIADYRLYPQVRFPAFLQDCAKAVVWAHENAQQYGADVSKLVLLGHSAGAYNAAMLALNPQYLKDAGGDRGWLRGMIGLAGPYDLLPITDPDLRDLFWPPENYEQTQPVYWVDGRNPPLLLLHGEDDDTVNIKNTRSLAERVQRAGGPVETVIYPKMSHRWIIATLASRLQGRSDVMSYVSEFVQRVTSAAPRPPQEDYGIRTMVPK
jgi:acetyl esterase/lipase